MRGVKPSDVPGRSGGATDRTLPVNHEPPPCVYFFAAPLMTGLSSSGDIGREKFFVGVPFRARSASSLSTTFDNLFVCPVVPDGGAVDVTAFALDPRFPFAGVGEVMRCGIAGTGGTSESCDIGDRVPFAWLLPGDGVLNVRSVMEPLLLDLRSPGRPAPSSPVFPLPAEDVEPLLVMRFVCMLPTGSGDVVCDRRAAAAAAEEREFIDCDR